MRLRRHQHRVAQRGEGVEVGQHGPVLVAGLAEAQARVDHDALGVDAGRDRGVDLLAELAHDVGDQVVVVGVLLHAAECSRQCISTTGAPVCGREAPSSRGRPARRRRR